VFKVTRTCEWCGKVYETYPYFRPRFCCQSCAGAAKRNGEYVACAQCGQEFYRRPSEADRRYCSKNCARTAANLTDRNPSYTRDISGERNPMYGRGMHGEENPMYGKRKHDAPRWKGGRKQRADGYILVVAPDDHPYPADQSKRTGLKYILEHRWVMEQHLGRYLRPEEVVHHINGDPTDNRIENLQLFASQSQHIRIAHPEGMRGEKHPNWRGGLFDNRGPNWKKQRAATLVRDNYTCRRCGITQEEYGAALDVHHIRRRGDFTDLREANRLENLVTLCERCHSQVEWG